MLRETALIIAANLVPTVEQFGAIPLGIALGVNPIFVLLISVITNSLLFFPVYFALELFYERLFSKIKAFKRYVEKARKKAEPHIAKYGPFGLILLTLLPGPFTGTYTASIVAWFFGLDTRKSFIAIAIGSLIGGIIVLLTSLGLFSISRLIFI